MRRKHLGRFGAAVARGLAAFVSARVPRYGTKSLTDPRLADLLHQA